MYWYSFSNPRTKCIHYNAAETEQNRGLNAPRAMIAQVEGERLDNLSEAEVISRILGAHGSKVSLTIRVHEGQVDSKVDRELSCRMGSSPVRSATCACAAFLTWWRRW